MEVNAELVRHHEFDLAHGVAAPWTLPHAQRRLSVSYRPPIHRRRINRRRISATIGEHFVVSVGEVLETLLENPRSDQLDLKRSRDVPLGIDVCVANQGCHHRRLSIFRTDGGAHRGR